MSAPEDHERVLDLMERAQAILDTYGQGLARTALDSQGITAGPISVYHGVVSTGHHGHDNMQVSTKLGSRRVRQRAANLLAIADHLDANPGLPHPPPCPV